MFSFYNLCYCHSNTRLIFKNFKTHDIYNISHLLIKLDKKFMIFIKCQSKLIILHLLNFYNTFKVWQLCSNVTSLITKCLFLS